MALPRLITLRTSKMTCDLVTNALRQYLGTNGSQVEHIRRGLAAVQAEQVHFGHEISSTYAGKHSENNDRRLAFAEPAARDLADIRAHCARDGGEGAVEAGHAIVTCIDLLCDLPEIGGPGRLPGTREWRVGSMPYHFAYQVTDGRVTIVAVFHRVP
jgi:plasmid stabilization system protein ParE